MSSAAVVWLFLAMVWGTTWFAVRVGLEALPPISFAGIRFLIAAVTLGLFSWVRRSRPPHGAEWWVVVASGVLAFAITYAAQFWGQQYISSGLAAVIFSSVPLWTIVLAHWFVPGERLVWSRGIGVVLGIAGVAIVVSHQFSLPGAMALWGAAAMIIGTFSMATAQIIVKTKAGAVEPTVLAALQMGIGGIVLSVLGGLFEGPTAWAGRTGWSATAVTSLLYLALIGSALSFSLFYWLLKRMDVTKVSAMMLVHPVVAVVLGWWWLDEAMDLRTVVGGVTILAGVALILKRPPTVATSRLPGKCDQLDSVRTTEWPTSIEGVAQSGTR